MARPEMETYRDDWWGQRLKGADTPKEKITVLQSKIVADISRLPEQHQDAAREMTVPILEGILNEIQAMAAEGALA